MTRAVKSIDGKCRLLSIGVALATALITARISWARERDSLETRVSNAIRHMTTEQQIAQLLLVGFAGTTFNGELEFLVNTGHIGGVVFYAHNIGNPGEFRALMLRLHQAETGVPLFVAIDQEGGEVARLSRDVPILPGNMALGATGSPALAERAGRAVGGSLRALGFTMNLAPVLDLATRPESPIGIRSFGSDSKTVASLGAAFVEGQAHSGMIAVAKHFPGIGSAAVDSHLALPVLAVTRRQLADREFVPFRAAVAAGVDAIMLGHVRSPIDGTLASTVSPKTVGRLRNDLHFDDVVITDVLQMRAARDAHDDIGQVAVHAIRAGADVVTVVGSGQDVHEVFTALRDAHRMGEITDTRLEQSVRRILRVKFRYATRAPLLDTDSTVAQDIADRSVTLLRNRATIVPLSLPSGRIAYVGPESPIDAVAWGSKLHVPASLTERAQALILAQIPAFSKNALIIGVAQNETQAAIVRAVLKRARGVPFIFVSLGSPQLVRLFPDAAAVICAYGYLFPSQNAVLRLLTGALRPEGRLPVAIPTMFALGDGLSAHPSVLAHPHDSYFSFGATP